MMGMEAHQLLVFIAAGWLLNLTPGPDVLYIISNAMRRGTWAGVVASLGIALGCLVHVAAAAVGVGALLATSAMAFTVLKVVGAAYLLWMGVRMLLSRAPAHPDVSGNDSGAALVAVQGGAAAVSLARVFIGGFWTNVLNPKVVVFFLAFVPQFIAPGTENKALAFVLLGVLFSVNAIPVNAGWALAAAWMARRAGAIERGMHWLDRAAGVMFIGFGLKLAFSDAPAA